MNINEIMKSRYTTKAYNKDKKIPAETIEKLEEVMQYGASSVNGQPWHFFIVSGDKKSELAEATESYNVQKSNDCSHLVVFCAKEYDEKHAKNVASTSDVMKMYEETLVGMAKRPDLEIWTAKQVYLNFGMFMVACASLAVDSTAMEGFKPDEVSKVLGLKEKGLKPLVMAALGYRDANDINDPSRTPKARLPKEQVITVIK